MNALGALIRNWPKFVDGQPFWNWGHHSPIPLGGVFLAVWVLLCQKSGIQGLILFRSHDPKVLAFDPEGTLAFPLFWFQFYTRFRVLGTICPRGPILYPFVLPFRSSFCSRLFWSSVYRLDGSLFVVRTCSLSIFRNEGPLGPVFRGIESTFRNFGPLYSRSEENDMLPVVWWNRKENDGTPNYSVKKGHVSSLWKCEEKGPWQMYFVFPVLGNKRGGGDKYEGLAWVESDEFYRRGFLRDAKHQLYQAGESILQKAQNFFSENGNLTGKSNCIPKRGNPGIFTNAQHRAWFHDSFMSCEGRFTPSQAHERIVKSMAIEHGFTIRSWVAKGRFTPS